jgi:hypothetical protein
MLASALQRTQPALTSCGARRRVPGAQPLKLTLRWDPQRHQRKLNTKRQANQRSTGTKVHLRFPCALRLHRPTCPPNGGRPPSFPAKKHMVAWHDKLAIDQDSARHAVPWVGAGRAPAVIEAVADYIPQASAGVHALAQSHRESKRKSPLDIVNAGRPLKEPNRAATRVVPAVDTGRPQKEPNQVATLVVPTVYPEAMQAVCNRGRGQDNLNFVPRSLA